MKKLKLNLDDLKVESFETTSGSSGNPGTVHGHGYTDDPPQCGQTGIPNPACENNTEPPPLGGCGILTNGCPTQGAASCDGTCDLGDYICWAYVSGQNTCLVGGGFTCEVFTGC